MIGSCNFNGDKSTLTILTMCQSFKYKVGIITGAASGLGRAIAKKLSENGASLALFDLDEEALRSTQAGLAGESEIYVIDITNEGLVKQAIEEVALRFGRIDILVNSAGITGKTNIKSHEVATED